MADRAMKKYSSRGRSGLPVRRAGHTMNGTNSAPRRDYGRYRAAKASAVRLIYGGSNHATHNQQSGRPSLGYPSPASDADGTPRRYIGDTSQRHKNRDGGV